MAFENIKKTLVTALALVVSDFSRVFVKLMLIGVVLSQINVARAFLGLFKLSVSF